MATEAQKRAVTKYNATTTKTYKLKLNLRTDQDILQKFADVESVNGYVKTLIRNDMKKRGL